MQGEAKVGRGFPYSSVLRERCARTEPASSSGCIAGFVFLYLALLCSAPAVVLSETGRPGRVKANPARIHRGNEKIGTTEAATLPDTPDLEKEWGWRACEDESGRERWLGRGRCAPLNPDHPAGRKAFMLRRQGAGRWS